MNFTMNKNSFSTQLEYGELTISGDETEGFRPFQLLVSAVAVCSGSVFRQIIDKKRISYKDIHISTTVIRDQEQSNKITDITVHFQLIGMNTSEDTIKKVMELTKRNCPIVQSVKDSIRVEETFELIAE
ncbi:OsmC family protein [Alkalihalobacillus trypoxylicola]|uniref:Osmotically inducible protein C n=1 Tax=Alkalihalobacillus trypoxylicola TaxID=519424 RepID=A0A162E7G7_9BACI|nr:OsmC family protein [Alkalihalobacillus trypoxylicola]KYG31961.1 osmotically inducible protein C [Alkalihalobacillus trypoxylicola]